MSPVRSTRRAGSAGAGATRFDAVAAQIRERAADYWRASGISGYLAGVHHDGGQVIVARGTANAARGRR